MVRRERRTTLTYGTSEDGFTLLEVVIALSIIAIAFTTLLEVLSVASSKYEDSRDTFEDMVFLDRKLKEKNHEGIDVRRRELPDFPKIKEVTYSYRGIFFIRYEAK